jgi:hypothetical protein
MNPMRAANGTQQLYAPPATIGIYGQRCCKQAVSVRNVKHLVEHPTFTNKGMILIYYVFFPII